MYKKSENKVVGSAFEGNENAQVESEFFMNSKQNERLVWETIANVIRYSRFPKVGLQMVKHMPINPYLPYCSRSQNETAQPQCP
jgi:hypothetical protein